MSTDTPPTDESTGTEQQTLEELAEDEEECACDGPDKLPCFECYRTGDKEL